MSDSILGLSILAINTKINNTKKDKETKIDISFSKEKED